MPESLIVISENQLLDNLNRGYIVHNSGLSEQAILSTHLSVIKPDFADDYSYGVSDTVRGVIMRIVGGGPNYDQTLDSFGFLELTGILADDERTSAFIPVIREGELELFENPPLAVVNFHRNVIHDVNASLERQRSSLRLATLALSSLQ
jgi:hypothetical protein